MSRTTRPARASDIDALAMAMPHVTRTDGTQGNAVYDVGGKSFVFFRNPRPDAVDPVTGARYDDVVVFWTPSLEEKELWVQDTTLPFFTTSHFDGYSAILLRTSRIAEVPVDVLAEIIEDAWLARASPARRRTWLAEHPSP